MINHIFTINTFRLLALYKTIYNKNIFIHRISLSHHCTLQSNTPYLQTSNYFRQGV